MSNFSGAVKLQDLSDFIAPSQACVVKLDGSKKLDLRADDVGEAGSVALKRPGPLPPQGGGGFAQTWLDADTSAVKVTLQDCLACSGCVTSAETVLLEHQSIGELRSKLQEAGTSVIVSVSPQSRASLAEASGLSRGQVQRRLTAFFSRLGAAAVLDTVASRDFSLEETAAEFLHRYRLAHPGATAAADGAAGNAPNGATSSQRAGAPRSGRPGAAGGLPVLASACPGWVCYAEKAHPALLPHISSAKSPQAVMGTLVKRLVCKGRGLDPARVYHATVMPCYDKKLEASRTDFDLPGSPGVAEVDCVLTTGEVAELLQQEGVPLASLPEAPLQPLLAGAPEGDDNGREPGYPGGSGGYLEHVFRTAAQELFGREVPSGPLQLKALRNADFKEVALEVDGRPTLRFAAVYGFRNIQTLVRKMKAGRCEYDYVEVMACPSGCLNGGGQLKPRAAQTQQQLIAALEEAYHPVAGTALRLPGESPLVKQLYASQFGGAPFSKTARQLLHTGYHARDKPTATAIVGDW